MKSLYPFALCLMIVFCTAWKTDLPSGITKPETTNVLTSYLPINATATRVDFSGEWKLNESKSERAGNFPICIFGEQDHISSKTMKIAEHADFLTLDVTSPSIDGELVPRQEKLTFDDKESIAIAVGSPREKSTARWSDDGQTMTVISVRSLDAYSEKADFKVTEVWQLINEGQSISIQVNSSSISGENTMKLAYDRQ